jgi:HSP20 family molecular chaperone IbpA
MSMEHHSIPVAVSRTGPENGPQVAPATEPSTVEPRLLHTPLIDIHEGPDGLTLEADLPGAHEDTISIQLEDNVLSLHAKVPRPAPDEARLLHEEYRVGDFYRSFILSDEVERSKITAEFRNGVLRLTLPKADRVKTRRIEIKS